MTEDTELRGVPIAAGDRVVMFYGSANRDEDVFAEPDRFDIGRSPNPHLAFGGGGPHLCLGLHVARIEIALDLPGAAHETPRSGPRRAVRTAGIELHRRYPHDAGAVHADGMTPPRVDTNATPGNITMDTPPGVANRPH